MTHPATYPVDFINHGWIQTYTGKRFSLAHPEPALVDIIDIAVSLSRTARYAGHTSLFYSVAQHSVLVSRVCETYPLLALMHDAAEAYIGDIVRPLKIGMGSELREVESRIHEAIMMRFGLQHFIPEAVHTADHRMLATERRDIMRHQLEWGLLNGHEPYEQLTIEPWSVGHSLHQFLTRFEALTSQPIDWDKVPKE